MSETWWAWIYMPWITIGETEITLARVAGLVFILVFVWWFSSLLEAGLRRVALRGHQRAPSSTVYAFTRLVRYLVWIVGTLVGLTYLGFNLASLAFLGGAIGVGIGFGLQNIFSNFISGIIILVEKTLKIGDFVDLESGVRGTVVEIGMRYTRIATNDAVDILVPNSEFINGRAPTGLFRIATGASACRSAWLTAATRSRCAQPALRPRAVWQARSSTVFIPRMCDS